MAIDTAMRRSVREGLVDLLLASLRPAIEPRQDIVGKVADVKSAFSSWDNCMSVTYCKWPVIAVIIVGGLIVFSVVWCIIRCACCGLSCCCSCCNFLKCCGNCFGCCDPPRGKRHKYLDEPYIPPNQGYKMQPPMNPHFPPVVGTMTPASTGVTTGVTSASVPQYAEFDVSKPKGGEDALPAMPSWEGADKKKVLVEEEAVEMDQLKKPEMSGQSAALTTGAAAAAPGTGISPVGSPGLNRSPYGPPGGAPPTAGYFPAPRGAEADPYGQPGQDYASGGGSYGQPMNMGADQGYGMAGGAVGMGAAAGQGRRSPYNDNGYGDGGYGQQGRGYGAPARQGSFDSYGAARQQTGGSYDSYGRGNQGYDYGVGARRSPPNDLSAGGGYGQDAMRRSPGPQAGYGSYDNAGYEARQFSSESSRPLRGPPQRQYTQDSSVRNVQNDSGFDFGTTAYSRPAAGGGGGYRQPSPPQAQQPVGYPGYKPYSPTAERPPQGGGGGGW